MRKYRLVAKKGEGTFSEVLKAQNVKDGKYYAIKCMKNRFDSIDQVWDNPPRPYAGGGRRGRDRVRAMDDLASRRHCFSGRSPPCCPERASWGEPPGG